MGSQDLEAGAHSAWAAVCISPTLLVLPLGLVELVLYGQYSAQSCCSCLKASLEDDCSPLQLSGVSP